MASLDWAPFLFLYSDDDPLCDAVKLSELIEDKQGRGQDVKAINWRESEHCGHLKHHETEYRRALADFLLQRIGGNSAEHRIFSRAKM